MKITKNAKATQSVKAATSKNKYQESREYIRAAIDTLGQTAKDDPVARESIANLSVVLLDLQK